MTTLPDNIAQLSSMIPTPERDKGCQILLQMQDLTKYGFLRKMPSSWSGRLIESMLHRKWPSKFVIIRSSCVYTYNSELAENCDRAYSLFGFTDVQELSIKSIPWVFKVTDGLQDRERDRSLTFSANSENEMKEWIKCFQQEMLKANVMVYSGTMPIPSKPKPTLTATASSMNPRMLPKLTDGVKMKMRESMNLNPNVNFCLEEEEDEDEDEDGDDYIEIEDSEMDENRGVNAGRTLPVPPKIPIALSFSSATLPPLQTKPTANKPNSQPRVNPNPESRVNPNPYLQPQTSVNPNPQPRVNPNLQTQTSVNPNPQPRVNPKPNPQPQTSVCPNPQTKPKPPPPITSPKPTLNVPPMSRSGGDEKQDKESNVVSKQSSLTNKPSNLKERKVPTPPNVKQVKPALPTKKKNDLSTSLSQISFVDDEDGYEGAALHPIAVYEEWDLKDQPVNMPLVKASCWPDKDFDKAQRIMISIKEDGVFLIRDSSDESDYKTLMVTTLDAGVRKYKILKDASQLFSLHLDESTFPSLEQLLQHYQKNPIPNRTTCLTKPYSEVWKEK